MLLDRPVNLIDEGIDVALRIGHLADSSMVATRIGEVRRVVVAAPRYLKQHPRIEEPADLAKHQIIAMAHFANSWTFPPSPGSSVPRTVQFTPRLVINSIRGAVASAVGGRGVARMFSYLSGRRAGARRRARNRAGGRRASAAAGACDVAARPARGAEGARLHGLCSAAAAQPLCASDEGRKSTGNHRAIVSASDAANRPMRCSLGLIVASVLR